jgi:hypothetical protein
MRCYNPPPIKKISSRDLSKGTSGARFKVTLMGEALKSWIVGNLHIPTWLHLLNDIPLHLIESSGLLLSGLIFLFQYLDGVGLVCQVWLEGNSIFNHHIRQGLQTSLELGNMEHVVNSRQL